MVNAWPAGDDPAAWRALVEEVDAERAELLAAHAEVVVDGLPAALRRRFDRALGVALEPAFVEVGPGEVVEVDGDGVR